MTVKEKIVDQGALLWKFLGFFQPPLLRCIHASVIVLVLLQFLLSTVMVVMPYGPSPLAWIHIIIGMFLCVLGISLVVLSIKKRGLRNFFPYLWGDTDQLVKDLRTAAQFKIVGPRPKGLPACVQGLGMCALLLAIFSGLWWFDDWSNDRSLLTVFSVHKFFVWSVALYVLGHGGMALAHFALWQRKAAPKK
ncbi:cytochrome b/b6 domain-containing protein [Desulfovibrio intestinalis]|uniref:Cytochrome b561 bacterial/Ni-hydrogenase domain-containing protein n=1 Tax=Desulfovibrio intestinalis TaxID=58621 RepID=A0A7W8C2Y1_9BACT|nr:cytochrome b/b6 domain-containing protein [Desulfovibrio intestinalis]MBB5143457.1 hypothetical protein [Desulfovibrio intestinalis]